MKPIITLVLVQIEFRQSDDLTCKIAVLIVHHEHLVSSVQLLSINWMTMDNWLWSFVLQKSTTGTLKSVI